MRTSIRASTALLLTGIAVYVAALVVLTVSGETSVRFSADTAESRPIWLLWLPVAAGFLIAAALPPRAPASDPFTAIDSRQLTRDTWMLVGAAVTFAIGLHLAQGDNLWFLILKSVLLLAFPLLVCHVTWTEWARLNVRGRWLRPALAITAYIVTTLVIDPGWEGTAPDIITVLAVFLINAVLEEVFYRFWLQTRLESRYGRWPAIILTSLLWAAWHSAIHGGNGLLIDSAAAILNIGVTGLFLGYLWSLHRNPWLLIAVHGFMNAPPAMLAAMV
ncbi:CPBP family intramembrane metalloprotease [Nocardia yamanashiensis]|uniref:CPBP family intramembrane glutamic endopeptidase n=1 Tax=Nocardia yamanashiensis TaxID=209247 RepID=UPI001E3ECC58|nr:CPBP family intramembrane glutamic endopeptidase [Nocardia yamanashiensis]UGT44833.1 CPBP family intramembrane metalloprotease [Nocardia yamanashiensis]